ncbi:MAG: cation diffusion facilitator family transporter [Muribaculaceae bacterium]|nr:cation diffusion facilitator family transporter [Muribaculaceae bacterium]
MSRTREIYRITLVGSVVNALLTAFKFFAGIVGHSSAMIADAVHSLSDFITDVVVILFVRIAGKPQDENHDYGHGKYETLAAVIVGIMLGCAGAYMLADGVVTIVKILADGLVPDAPNYWALSAAALSILLKEALYHYTIAGSRRLDSQALRANAWHHRSDAFTSIATLAGIAGAMLPGVHWRILDPIAATVVSLFIIKAAAGLIKPNLDELLESSLPAAEKERIADIITSTPGVVRIHRLRTRRIGNAAAIEVHIKLPADMPLATAHDIATEVERRLKSELGPATHTAIHMEPAYPSDGGKG